MAISQVAQAPLNQPSRDTQTVNRPDPLTQRVQGGFLTLPLVTNKKAPRVCERECSVDFSGGSSIPAFQGICLISGKARRLSNISGPFIPVGVVCDRFVSEALECTLCLEAFGLKSPCSYRGRPSCGLGDKACWALLCCGIGGDML